MMHGQTHIKLTFGLFNSRMWTSCQCGLTFLYCKFLSWIQTKYSVHWELP